MTKKIETETEITETGATAVSKKNSCKSLFIAGLRSLKANPDQPTLKSALKDYATTFSVDVEFISVLQD